MVESIEQSYFEILNVTTTSSSTEVRSAYLKAKELYNYDRPEVYRFFTEEEARALNALVEDAFHKITTSMLVAEGLDESFDLSQVREWTGENIKLARLSKRMTLDMLFEKTKIKPWYLQAIENMDAANLPPQVFVRGYIVQIAKAIGLNEKDTADSYMKFYSKIAGPAFNLNAKTISIEKNISL